MFKRSSKKKSGNRVVAFKKKDGSPFSRFLCDDLFPLSSSLWEDMAFPRFDMSEDDSKIIVKAEVPGVDKQDIQISVDGRVMTILGEKKQEDEEENTNFHRIERTYGSFKRMIRLPADVDNDHIKATCKRGVLKIILKKKRPSQGQKIEIKAN